MKSMLNFEEYYSKSYAREEINSLENLNNFEFELMDRIENGETPVNSHPYPIISNPFFLALEGRNLRSSKNLCYFLLGSALHIAMRQGMPTKQIFVRFVYYQNSIESASSVDLLDSLTDEMLNELAARVRELRAKSTYPYRVTSAINYIMNNLHLRVSSVEVCQAACCSKSQLNRDFRKYTGMSIQEFILKEKIEAAKRYLKKSTTSISEISVLLGFSGSAHFSKAFKSFEGITPTQYRRLS